MSHHVENTQCPRCKSLGRDRSKNNLGVFSDGHCVCWSCRHFIPATSNGKFTEYVRHTITRDAVVVCLPEDVSSILPPHCLDWLGKYSITNAEIVNNRLMYSPHWDQLIFPYFDGNGTLLAYQARNFSKETKQKWWSQGKLHELLHILPLREKYDTIILVEDIVSAIKVSRWGSVMPLFGCITGLERLRRLSLLTPEVTHWLDPDKRSEALKWSNKASLFGMVGGVIFTAKDPKEHSDEEIICYLEDSE